MSQSRPCHVPVTSHSLPQTIAVAAAARARGPTLCDLSSVFPSLRGCPGSARVVLDYFGHRLRLPVAEAHPVGKSKHCALNLCPRP